MKSARTKRSAKLLRRTKETSIRVELSVDGTGRSRVRTGIAFLDHMIESMAKHGRFDIRLTATGDLQVDTHHTNEDVGIALGTAFRQALGDKAGIRRFGDFRAPLDEALAEARVSLDLSGRGSFHLHTRAKTRWVEHPAVRSKPNAMNYTLADAKHFLESLAANMGATLHVELIAGEYPHHVIEATFKALARALDQAVTPDARTRGIPSTKGRL
ncbi:MAG: Imidazoleglycerol-phosphate dehydratase [Candidatus Omnitrophica bacterium]|nr:Imidazoleglycerol-phosphate dehydratase [Candidatus Omnitrophota bacterium]